MVNITSTMATVFSALQCSARTISAMHAFAEDPKYTYLGLVDATPIYLVEVGLQTVKVMNLFFMDVEGSRSWETKL